MAHVRRTLFLSGFFFVGCAPGAPDFESMPQALDICAETVPANRQVDGIPAYAQCASTQTSAIYSNNGVDTATTSGGAGWIRTQYSGGYQCTEFAHRYVYFKWNVSWIPNGNAGTWCDTTPPADRGIVQTTTPVHGDLIVFGPGVCGASADTGHVAVVDVVDTAKSQVTLVEQNNAGRRNSALSCAKCFLHVVANTGATAGPPDAGLAVDARPALDLARETGPLATGGQPATGGTLVVTGGTPSSSGGVTVTGGTPSSSGGMTATGGAAETGGASSTGGTTTRSGGDPLTVTRSSDGGCAYGGSPKAGGPLVFALWGILLVRGRRRR
jgi:hypothetical protein